MLWTDEPEKHYRQPTLTSNRTMTTSTLTEDNNILSSTPSHVTRQNNNIEESGGEIVRKGDNPINSSVKV